MTNPPIYIDKPNLYGHHAIEIYTFGIIKTVLWCPCMMKIIIL